MKPTTHNKLLEMLEFAKTHNLMEMAWQDNGVKIAFRRKNSPAKMASGQIEVSQNGHSNGVVKIEEAIVKSPIVGTFRRALSKGRPPLVLEGNHVKPGDRLGVVECMRIPTDVVSFCQGQIVKIMVEDGQVVEYGQPLFMLTPTTEVSDV